MGKAKVIFEQETSNCVQLRYPDGALKHLVDYYIEIAIPENHPEDFSIVALPSLNTLLSVPITAFEKHVYNHSTSAQYTLTAPKILGNLTEAISCFYPPGAKEFAIKFKPGLLQQLLAIKPQLLTDSQLPLAGHLPASLLRSILGAPDFASRIAMMENYLKTKTLVSSAKLAFVQKALTLIHNASHLPKTTDMGREIGLSVPTLNRYFREILGLSPRQCAKILRLKTALKYYRTQGSAGNYNELGYTDFSHFVKDTKSLTQQTPSKL